WWRNGSALPSGSRCWEARRWPSTAAAAEAGGAAGTRRDHSGREIGFGALQELGAACRARWSHPDEQKGRGPGGGPGPRRLLGGGLRLPRRHAPVGAEVAPDVLEEVVVAGDGPHVAPGEDGLARAVPVHLLRDAVE